MKKLNSSFGSFIKSSSIKKYFLLLFISVALVATFLFSGSVFSAYLDQFFVDTPVVTTTLKQLESKDTPFTVYFNPAHIPEVDEYYEGNKYGIGAYYNCSEEVYNEETYEYECLDPILDLCPYLSITPNNEEDTEVGFTQSSPWYNAGGQLSNPTDMTDNWTLSIKSPCFEGECPADYNESLNGVPLPQSYKGKTFKCDLEASSNVPPVLMMNPLLPKVAYAVVPPQNTISVTAVLTGETQGCTVDCFSNVLFLPGFEGSRLYKPDYNGGTTNLWEPNGNNEQVQNLLMNTNGTATREDIYTKDVIDNAYYVPVIGDVYKHFLSQLDSMKNPENHIINDYLAVPYDWRLSIDDILNNGDKTDDGKIYYSGILGQTNTPYIIKELRRLANNSKTGKVTIVAHSNGGLITKALTNKLGSEASDLIDKIIFVAVPQVGTPQAVGGLLHGFDQALPKDYLSFLGISKEAIRNLGQNMPSSYNLLPSSPYFTYVDDPVITFDDSAMLAPWRSKYGSVIHSAETMHSFLTDQSRTTMPTSKDIYSPTILNEFLLNKAEITHSTLDNWTPPSGVKLTQIAGWGEYTLKTLEYYQGIKSNCTFPIIPSLCSTSPVLEYKPITVLDGDGTVLTPSALWTPESDNVKRYWVDIRSYNKQFFNISRSHANILEVPQLRTFIQNIITNNTDTPPEFILTSAPENTNDEYLHFILHSPLSLDLYDDQGNHTGISESTNMPEENIPGSSYKTFGEVKYISVPNSNKLHLSMNGYEAGSFTLDIEESNGNTITNTTTFAAVPTSPDTIVTLDIPKDGGIADISPLSVDGNGDGVSDLTLIPQLDEIVVPDFTPPEPKISIDPTTKDLKIESEADTTISKNSNTYTLTDKAGNTTKLFFQKTFLGKSLTLAKLTGIQYNNDTKITLPNTSFLYLWNILKNHPTLLSQTIAVDKTYIIEAVYDTKKNQTIVYLKKKGTTIQKKIFSGLHISKLTLEKGVVGYEL